MQNMHELVQIAIAALGDHIGQSQLITRRLAKLKDPEILRDLSPFEIEIVEIRICRLLIQVANRCNETLQNMYGDIAAMHIINKAKKTINRGGNND